MYLETENGTSDTKSMFALNMTLNWFSCLEVTVLNEDVAFCRQCLSLTFLIVTLLDSVVLPKNDSTFALDWRGVKESPVNLTNISSTIQSAPASLKRRHRICLSQENWTSERLILLKKNSIFRISIIFSSYTWTSSEWKIPLEQEGRTKSPTSSFWII